MYFSFSNTSYKRIIFGCCAIFNISISVFTCSKSNIDTNFLFIIFIATLRLLSLCIPKRTKPNFPFPNTSRTSYISFKFEYPTAFLIAINQFLYSFSSEI